MIAQIQVKCTQLFQTKGKQKLVSFITIIIPFNYYSSRLVAVGPLSAHRKLKN